LRKVGSVFHEIERNALTVAKNLALSDRTLSRHLADEGTTYAEVVDQLRRSLALQYLKEPAWDSHRSRGCRATRDRPRSITPSGIERAARDPQREIRTCCRGRHRPDPASAQSTRAGNENVKVDLDDQERRAVSRALV
jgi:AraC-like DNA-binding protein